MSALEAQRFEALDRANRVRMGRAKVKRELRDGDIEFVDALMLECCASAHVGDLLIALPQWGRVKVSKALRQAGVSWTRPCSGLSVRERAALVGFVAGVGSVPA